MMNHSLWIDDPDYNSELGMLTIDDEMKRKDITKVRKIASDYQKLIDDIEKQKEAVKERFWEALEKNGFDNSMGLITYKK